MIVDNQIIIYLKSCPFYTSLKVYFKTVRPPLCDFRVY
jgi:hypothetical protein